MWALRVLLCEVRPVCGRLVAGALGGGRQRKPPTRCPRPKGQSWRLLRLVRENCSCVAPERCYLACHPSGTRVLEESRSGPSESYGGEEHERRQFS
uniref:Putative secreted protein n=1 Tax=Ixodes ricinus TaxID=34613 RepID=A0A6B0U445_IXORI